MIAARRYLFTFTLLITGCFGEQSVPKTEDLIGEEAEVVESLPALSCPCEPKSEFAYPSLLDAGQPRLPHCRPEPEPEDSSTPGGGITDRVRSALVRLSESGSAIPEYALTGHFSVDFVDLKLEAATEADAVSLPTGSSMHRILVDERHRDADPALLAPLVVHELLHEDLVTSRDEELAAIVAETLAAAELLRAGTECDFENELGRRYRGYILMLLFNAETLDASGVVLPGRLGGVEGPVRMLIPGNERPAPTTEHLSDLLATRCLEASFIFTSEAVESANPEGFTLPDVDLRALARCQFGGEGLADLARKIGLEHRED